MYRGPPCAELYSSNTRVGLQIPQHIHTRTHMRIHLQSLANYKFTTSAVLYIATVTFFSVVISHWFIPLLSPSRSFVITDVEMETE